MRHLFSELHGEPIYGGKRGEIVVNQHYFTRRKPAWLVLLKLIALAAMVAVGFAIALPSLRGFMPERQLMTLIAGVMLIYTGIAFFVRPEPNGDNMGWLGGLANDPMQYSDDINRQLWSLHCLLGPGRFAAETLLDTCVLFGIAGGEEVEAATPHYGDEGVPQYVPLDLTVAEGEPADETAAPALSPDRFARKR